MVWLPKTTRKGVYENIQLGKKSVFLTHSNPSQIKDWIQNTSWDADLFCTLSLATELRLVFWASPGFLWQYLEKE